MLDEEVQRLPEKYRAPFVLCCLEGKSKPEAACELGWREGTVSSRLARARALLQERLTRRGLTLSAVLCAGSLWEQCAAASIPRALVRATARAAAEGAGGGGVSAGVAALAEGAVKVAWLTPWHVGAVLLVGFGLLAAGVGAWAARAGSGDPARTGAGAAAPAAVRKDLHGDPLPPGALARLGTLRQRAAESHLAVTADGREVVAVSPDLTVRRFDARTGELRATRQLPGGRSSGLWLSPRGKFALTSNLARPDARSLGLWDLAGGKCADTLSLGVRSPWGVSFSGDERRVAIADSTPDRAAHRVLVWDLETSRSRVLWSGQKTSEVPVSTCFDPLVVMSPDGKRLAARHFDDVLRCWDVEEGKLLWEEPAANRSPFVFFSPDGRTLVSAAALGKAGIHLRDAATGKLLEGPAPPPEAIYPLGYSPDGRFLAFQTASEAVVLWEPGAARVAFRFALSSPLNDGINLLPHGLPTNFAFTPDGKGLVRRAGTLQRWDLATGKPLYPDAEGWGHREEVSKLVFSPDGRLLASAAKDQRARLWEVATGRPLREFPKGLSDHLAFTPDGRHLLTVPFDTQKAALRLWGVADGRGERAFDVPGEPLRLPTLGRELRVTADGKRILMLTPANAGRRDESVLSEWDVATGECLRHEPVPWGPGSLLGPDGRDVVAFDSAVGVVKLFRVETAQPLAEFPSDRVPDPQRVPPDCNLARSPDGRLVAARARFLGPAGDRDEYDSLRIVDARTGRQVAQLGAAGPALFDFSADGQIFVVADAEGLRLWETASWKEVGSIPAPDREAVPPGRAFASSLAISPDGRLLATGHADSTILLWDATLRGGARGGLLAAAEADALWADLAGADAARAYAAVWRLADDAGRSVPLLRQRLRPAAGSPEADSPGETIRGLRAVQILERVGSPEARDALERLAGGEESARLTRAATEALARMAVGGRP